MLWFFQIVFLQIYYQNMKTSQVRIVADRVELAIKTDTMDDINLQLQAVNNNVCGLVYNERGVLLYQVDSLGLGCYLTQRIIANPANVDDYIERTRLSNSGDFILPLKNSVLRQDMLVYGREIKASFGNFYIFLNSPLDPLDSTISILKNQFIYVTIAVFIFSSIVSVLISSKMANPIVKMNKSAQKLAKGDYSVNFEKSEYSEINELATTLNYATQELGKMDELRKDLIANVSHDIKTPLTMIKAYAEMIKDLSGNNPIKRDEHLDVILAEVNHLDRLVNDMTQISQLQSSVLTIQDKEFDLVAMVHSTLKLVEGLIHNNAIEVEIFSPSEVWVHGDDVKIQQVIYNFVNNAIKHIGDDKKLEIQILLEDRVRIEIIDHGDGISDEDLPYIWDRYYKIDKNYQRQTEGTGLGLAIASAILKSHHANFGAISKVGEGSTFWFELEFAKQIEV